MELLDLLVSLYLSAWRILFGQRRRQLPAEPPEDISDRQLEELLDEFGARRNGRTILDSAGQAFRELARIPVILRWDDGLRESIHNLVLSTVQQAERYGDGTGALKRRFAVDIMTRVLRKYEEGGLLEVVEDVVIKPFLGVFVDWCVEILNLHNAWPPVKHVRIPALFQGRYGKLLRVQVFLWHVFVRLRDLFFFPSKYERNLRDALQQMDPEIRALTNVLPPSQLGHTVESLVNVVSRIGRLTAPHIRTLDNLLRLVHEMYGMTPEGRRDLVIRAFRILLRRAYAGNEIAQTLLDSDFGDLLLSEMVRFTEGILIRSGLLPQSQSAVRVF